MEGTYEVMYCDRVVGKVQVQRQGLYYRFIARCKNPDKRVCRLVAQWQAEWENLGILIPEGDGMVLDRKLPAKKMPQVSPVFRLIPSEWDIQKTLEPPKEEAPEVRESEEQPDEEPAVQEEPAQTVSEESGETQQEPQVEIWEEVQAHPQEQKSKSPGKFLPIHEDEPFDGLEKLEQAVLAYREGESGAWIPEE